MLSRPLILTVALAGLRFPITALAARGGVGTVNAAYTAKIREYTAEKFFLTELVDPPLASETVPSPEKVLGYVVGAPDPLTYSKDIYRYHDALKASPRVKVFDTGKTEAGRDTRLVAISDEGTMKDLDHWREVTARLADPRGPSEADAEQLI